MTTYRKYNWPELFASFEKIKIKIKIKIGHPYFISQIQYQIKHQKYIGNINFYKCLNSDNKCNFLD